MKPSTSQSEDVSKGELKLRQLDNRDRFMRTFEAIALLMVVGFNILTVVNLQRIISQNQKDTLEARKANIDRQTETQAYIKCILLLRYDNPELNPASPRTDVEQALDKCASR